MGLKESFLLFPTNSIGLILHAHECGSGDGRKFPRPLQMLTIIQSFTLQGGGRNISSMGTKCFK